MRGKPKNGHKGNQYYDKRRRANEEEWVGVPFKNQNGKKKFSNRFDGRDYDYKYIHKDKKIYSRKEFYELFPEAFLPKDELQALLDEFSTLMIATPYTDFIGDDTEICESWFIENNEDKYIKPQGPNKRHDGQYPHTPWEDPHAGQEKDEPFVSATDKQGRIKQFEKFAFDEDDDDGLEDADKMLENRWNGPNSRPHNAFGNDDLPEWALEEGIDEEMPIWNDIGGNEVKEETQDHEAWESKYVRKSDKEKGL